MTRYLCDNRRHLICDPYSIEGLHRMAEALGIARAWYHGGAMPHYDIPARRVAEITARCTMVSPREIVRIIREAQAPLLGGGSHRRAETRPPRAVE